MTAPIQLDPLLHSAPRITIMSRMVVHRRMRFAALRRSTGLTAGNLASHVKALVGAGYLAAATDESKVERRTTVHVTPAGESAYRAYLGQLRALLASLEPEPSRGGPGDG
jgi:DNA-binding MarR family transcriptional regulator